LNGKGSTDLEDEDNLTTEKLGAKNGSTFTHRVFTMPKDKDEDALYKNDFNQNSAHSFDG